MKVHSVAYESEGSNIGINTDTRNTTLPAPGQLIVVSFQLYRVGRLEFDKDTCKVTIFLETP
jgi:hypothetical protein